MQQSGGVGHDSHFVLYTFHQAGKLLQQVGVAQRLEVDMAVAVGMLDQIVLMLLLGRIKIAQRLDFDGQGSLLPLFFTAVRLLDSGHVGSVFPVDAGAVARALVLSLPVDAQWVDDHKEGLHQPAKRHFRRVVCHLDSLGIAGSVGIDFTV